MLDIVVALSVATFNLNCTGSFTTKSLFSDSTESYNYVYRLDMDKKIYCDGECKAQRPIFEISPTQITMRSSKVDSPSERSLNFESIDRENGQHLITTTFSDPRDRNSVLIMKWAGKCEKAPFSGFPKFETKF